MAPHDGTRRPLTRKWGIRVAALSLVAGLCAACSSGSGSSSASDTSKSGQAVDITIVDGSTAASAILPYFAETAGIFKKYNINATVKFVGAGLALPQLASGKAQF